MLMQRPAEERTDPVPGCAEPSREAMMIPPSPTDDPAHRKCRDDDPVDCDASQECRSPVTAYCIHPAADREIAQHQLDNHNE